MRKGKIDRRECKGNTGKKYRKKMQENINMIGNGNYRKMGKRKRRKTSRK